MSQVATKQRRAKASRKRAPAPPQKRGESAQKRGASAPQKGARAQTPAKAKTSARAKANAKPPKATGAVSKPAKAAERRGGQGGRRLASAFDAASRLPALAESRQRLLRASEGETSSPAELAEAIESDVALTTAIMRAAGDAAHVNGSTGGVRQAIDALGASGVREVVGSIDAYDPFQSPSATAERYERFRRHAVATRHAADRIAELARLSDRDELAVAALLHDVGSLVLADMYAQLEELDYRVMAPEERVRFERRELGIDHALVGAVLVRRWRLPRGVAAAVERHHAPEADGHAAAIRLADLVVHHAHGDAAPPEAMVDAASRLGIERERIAPLLYEFPHSGEPRRRATDPCPLSVREIDALRGLAEGKVYKQIARELSLSVSTIRTHLHNVYRKIDAVDRAQAVLIARDRGWI
jgi:putative nucleotidyltransferase with HDIG domain